MNDNAVHRATASIIRYSMGKKIIIIFMHIFDRPKSGFVQAKKYLAGHHDRRPAVRYLEPCFSKLIIIIYDLWPNIIISGVLQ